MKMNADQRRAKEGNNNNEMYGELKSVHAI